VDPSLGGSLLLEHQPQERRLTRPGRADEEDELALLNIDVDVFQRRPVLTRVQLGDVIEVDNRFITRDR